MFDVLTTWNDVHAAGDVPSKCDLSGSDPVFIGKLVDNWVRADGCVACRGTSK